MSLQSGTRLAQYEVLAALGAGGMGEVYRALDTKLGREVAVKILPEAFSRDANRLRRFEREAKLLASLNHASIATLHDFSHANGTHFIVMELVEGETLADRIARAPLGVREAISLFLQIAEGLEAAHEHGILHRDLKPANILVTPDGKVKILDFGLARLEDGREPSHLTESPTRTKGTDAGIILGTAPYMSPEQAKGQEVDRRTDIWALGCIFCEALTGKSPFRRDTVPETIAAILDAEPDWEGLPKTTPPRLVELLRRCLRKNLRVRVQHAGDVRIGIEEAAHAEPVPAVGEARRSSKLVAAMALATAIALGLALWSVLRLRVAGPAGSDVTRTVIPLPEGEPLALELDGSLAISPDGRIVAYVTQTGSDSRLYLRHLDRLESVRVQEADGARMPFFSPDSGRVGWGPQAARVPVRGGAPVRFPGSVSRGASWSPEGVVTSSTNGLVRIVDDDAPGGEPISTIRRERGEKTHRFADVLPGGEAVLFTLGADDIESWEQASIAVASVPTGEHRVVLQGGMSARYTDAGYIVFARAESLWAAPFDLSELAVTGTAVEVVEGVAMSRTSGSAEFALSREGTLVYAPGGIWDASRRVVRIDRDGRSEPLIQDLRGYSGVDIAPDGGAVALAITAANDSIWIYDLERGTLTRMIYGSDNIYPAWSPRGDRVAFSSNRDGFYNYFWQPVTAGGSAVPIIKQERTHSSGDWSPNGEQLVFQASDDIWMVSVGGEPEHEATPLLQESFLERYPRISPDGRFMAYASDESGREEVYVRRYPDMTERQQVSAAGGTQPVWSPDGSEIFYLAGDAMMSVPARTESDSIVLGTPLLLFERPTASALSLSANRYSFQLYDVTPDGRHFLMLEDVETGPPPTHLVLVQNFGEELERLVPR